MLLDRDCEVKEVTRKVLLKALVALKGIAILSTALVGLVNAGKGQTKETYWFYVNGSIAEPEPYTNLGPAPRRLKCFFAFLTSSTANLEASTE